MTRDEALAVLNVTVRRLKWLLLQAHPDRHPSRESTRGGGGRCAKSRCYEACLKQAMGIMCRHVTEVLLED